MALRLNPYFYHQLGHRVIRGLVPFLEEILKTGFAWLLDTSIVGTHGVFGLVEFLWDLFRPGPGHWAPALMGFISHLFFGLLTQWAFHKTGFLFWGILLAWIVHISWNRFTLIAESKLMHQGKK